MNPLRGLMLKFNKTMHNLKEEEIKKEELVPPQKLNSFVGGGDFKQIGEEFFKYFVELGSLKPNQRVLDVGCGTGRMAVPLMNYLDQKGSYEGFDIDSACIDWCKKNISPKCPTFNFQRADIYNKLYNPGGKYKAREYKFPYIDESFDFVFLTSVFTHLLPEDMENYLAEIARVLKRDGACLITFFLANEESLSLIQSGQSSLNFLKQSEKYLVVNVDRPEDAVAYDEPFVLNLYEKYGLKIKQPLHYGSWCGRKDFLSYQDVIVASKQ